MATIAFQGVGGRTLQARRFGSEEDPGVLLVLSSPAAFGEDVIRALTRAGRAVLALELPEGSAAADDLRSVLDQMASRPVVVADGGAAPAAKAAIGDGAAHGVRALVLVDHAEPPRAPSIPVLLVLNSGAALTTRDPPDPFLEIVRIEEGSAAERVEQFNALLLDFLERRAPRSGAEYRAGADPKTLREALGCFATGVTVVTTIDPSGAPVGLTANSFTSVSLDPPLLLVCIARGGSLAPIFEGAGRFAVNVLHIGQQPISHRFAQRAPDRFEGAPWRPSEHGVPILASALATFECARHAVHEGGDHIILVGLVERARFEPQRDPLLYFRGKYRRLHFS